MSTDVSSRAAVIILYRNACHLRPVIGMPGCYARRDPSRADVLLAWGFAAARVLAEGTAGRG